MTTRKMAVFCLALMAIGLSTLEIQAQTQAKRSAVFECAASRPDIEIYGVRLGDDRSFRQKIGSAYKEVYGAKTSDFPWAVFFSSDGRQTLALRRHPGGGSQDYMEAEVQLSGRKASANLGAEKSDYMGKELRDQILPSADFETNNGVKLGLTTPELAKILKNCFKPFRKDGYRETIRYKIADERSKFLEKYAMPEYYAEYQLDHDRLVRFRFGFPYP
jgi:hypothetical protein